ncbi:uncharacterized protein A4U43_C05F11730 [Asparagus officinalis]|uniref:Uncharacterized protein n=1 Tax=Asparagus officinalis TaxID=4686 RepID=A0A5P1ETM4_ASPOF|nr:uncharacterized protein A4U43_C05F11730 [Asparagus officinalis]
MDHGGRIWRNAGTSADSWRRRRQVGGRREGWSEQAWVEATQGEEVHCDGAGSEGGGCMLDGSSEARVRHRSRLVSGVAELAMGDDGGGAEDGWAVGDVREDGRSVWRGGG